MLKSHRRTAKPRRQVRPQTETPFSPPALSLDVPKLKQVTKLLIVDDNPHARHGLCAILTSQPGAEVAGEASQGNEAISLMETLHPDVVLMDVRMPVSDGIETARVIKSRWPRVRVVLISMYAEYRVEALSIGADAFVVKGCPAEELIAAVIGQQPDTALHSG